MTSPARALLKDDRIAGALFDFLGYLTTRNHPVILSAYHDSLPGIVLLREWADARGLSLKDVDAKHWNEQSPPAPEEETAAWFPARDVLALAREAERAGAAGALKEIVAWVAEKDLELIYPTDFARLIVAKFGGTP